METLTVVVIATCLAGMLGLYVRELQRQAKVLKLHKRIANLDVAPQRVAQAQIALIARH